MKKDVLLNLFSKLQFKKAIIYSDNKMHLREIEKIMSLQDIAFATVNNQMDSEMQKLVINQFRSGEIRVFITTDLYAKYIVDRSVDLFINY